MPKSHAHAVSFRVVLRQFALLGQPLRVVILQRLARAPTSAGELARGMPVTRTAVVQHLKLLEAAGLVAASTQGRKRIYRLAPMGLAPLRRWLDAHMGTAGKACQSSQE